MYYITWDISSLLTLELLLSSSAHSFALRDRSLLPRRLNQTDIVSGDTLTNSLSCLNVFNYCRGNENVRASRLAARSLYGTVALSQQQRMYPLRVFVYMACITVFNNTLRTGRAYHVVVIGDFYNWEVTITVIYNTKNTCS